MKLLICATIGLFGTLVYNRFTNFFSESEVVVIGQIIINCKIIQLVLAALGYMVSNILAYNKLKEN